MALARFYKVIQDTAGNIVTNVQTTVKIANTMTLGSLFSDDGGTIPLANPLTNDPTYGSIAFYTTDGIYDLSFAKVGFTFEDQPDTIIGRASFARVSEDIMAVAGAAQLETPSVIIPVGARPLAVFVTNVVAFGTTNDITGYDIGDVTIVNRWGDNIPVTLNNQTTSANFQEQGLAVYPQGSRVYLTARNGLFDGNGQARIEVEYYLPTAS